MSIMSLPHKVLVILGPTATGKSDLAVEAALKLNGEVISADSRQVYRGLDIGTGKITREEMKGVRHWLLDVADPHDRFTVAEWKKQAEVAIADIVGRGKLPIICGGTGFYISALIDRIEFPEVETDRDAQKELESMPASELFAMLEKLDPRRASTMTDNGEKTNKRRLARAILIARELGAVPPNVPAIGPSGGRGILERDALYLGKVSEIGLTIPDDELKARIRARLIKRLDHGMIEEATHLHTPPPAGAGLSHERMHELGLEYRYLAEFLQGRLDREGLIETLSAKIWQYARRQKTWFKRDPRIHWFSPEEAMSALIRGQFVL